MEASSLRQDGCLESDDSRRDQETHRHQTQEVLYVRRWALRRGFEAFPEDAQRVVQRRDVAFPGQWELVWYADCMSC